VRALVTKPFEAFSRDGNKFGSSGISVGQIKHSASQQRPQPYKFLMFRKKWRLGASFIYIINRLRCHLNYRHPPISPRRYKFSGGTGGQMPVKRLNHYQQFALGTVLLYQLVLLYQHDHQIPVGTDVTPLFFRPA